MTRARAALLLWTMAVALTAAAFTSNPLVQPALAERGVGDRQVVVFVVGGVSFQELLLGRRFRQLAGDGGAALMTTRGARADELAYAILGSGTDEPPVGPTLLAKALADASMSFCEGSMTGVPLTPGQPSLLSVDTGRICASTTGTSPALRVYDAGDFGAGLPLSPGERRRLLARGLPALGETGRAIVRALPARSTLVIVVTPSPSPAMDEVGDEVTPLLMAQGMPNSLFGARGGMRSLRSDTTRQTGLVANVDVAPTILEFFGIPIPAEMGGQPIEITDEPAPFELHRRHLEQRRIRLPIQLAEVSVVAASGAVAIVVLLVAARRRSLPPRVSAAMRFLTLCVAALPIPLILGGVLPRLTYGVVVPFLILSVLALATLARMARWPGLVGPFTFLGVAGLGVVIVDGLFSWQGARIPLLGGTMFDGARFYGLPNSFLGLLLASALFAAAALPPFPGFMVLVGAGLFAGFPSLGADIGGAATLLFAAGMWWVLRTRRRFGVKEAAFVAGVVALGVGAVLLAHRYLPGAPTHASRFVETTGDSLGDGVRAYGDRLSIGFRQLKEVPAAWIPIVGLPVILGLVLARRGPIGRGLELAGRRWVHVLVVITLAGVVAFFANDTGVAAAAPVFLYAMAGMAYPAFLVTKERRAEVPTVTSP